MACTKYTLTNTGTTSVNFNYRRCDDSMWEYQVQLDPNQTKNIWAINGTYTIADYFKTEIGTVAESVFPPQGLNLTPTPTAAITSTPTPTPTNTSTPTVTPTNSSTPTPTPTEPIRYLQSNICHDETDEQFVCDCPGTANIWTDAPTMSASTVAFSDPSGANTGNPEGFYAQDGIVYEVTTGCGIGCTTGATITVFGPCGLTPTPTATVTQTPTNSATPTPTVTQTPTNSATPTPTVTQTPTNSETPTPTVTPESTQAETPTNTPTNTETPTPTNTPTNTETPTNTPTNTETPTPTVTETPTNTPTPTSGATVDGWSFYGPEGPATYGPPTNNGNTIFVIPTGNIVTYNPNYTGQTLNIYFNTGTTLGTSYLTQFQNLVASGGTLTASQGSNTVSYSGSSSVYSIGSGFLQLQLTGSTQMIQSASTLFVSGSTINVVTS